MKVIGNLHILGQKSIIKMNTSPANNLDYSGWVSDEFVDEDVTVGQALYFDITTQRWKLAKADSKDTMPARALALENIGAGGICRLLRNGTIRLDSQNFNKQFIYVSDTTAGEFVLDPPTTTGSIIQQIGTPVRNNTAWFDFNSFTKTVG